MELKKKGRMFSILALLCVLSLMGCAGQRGASDPVASIKRENLKEHVRYQVEEIGIRVAGTPEEAACGDYIYEQLKSYGYGTENTTLERKPFTLSEPHSLTSENMIATIPASGEAKGILVITAHYDTMGETPGARDNAAGISALLELSRILYGVKLPYELRFLVLGSEENGNWGSREYVKSLTEEEIQAHLAVYNMDITIATEGRGDILTCNTLGGRSEQGYEEGDVFEPADNVASRSIEAAFETLSFGNVEDRPKTILSPYHYGDSDHVSFHEVGIDAVNVCWRKDENGFAKLPQEYHLSSDNMENLDFESLYRTTACIATAVLDMK